MKAPPAADIDPMLVFDRRLVGRHRQRAAASLDRHAYLFEAMAEAIVERLGDIARRFPRSLDLGAHQGGLGRRLLAGGTTDFLTSCDLAPGLVAAAPGLRLAADEEWLPFKDGSFDLVASAGSLHWVNDLPGALIQMRALLAPGGIAIASFVGGASLGKLRRAMLAAEPERPAARLHPLIDPRSCPALLQRAGWTDPIVDTCTLTARYASLDALVADLRMQALGSVLADAPPPLTRKGLDRARAAFLAQADDDARVSETFEIVTLTGRRSLRGT